MAKNTGVEYEKLVQYIFNQIINRTDVNNIDVKHNVVLQGKTSKHQIDVYWKFETGGIEYSAIVQAKNWKTKVKKEHILALRGILDDLPSGTKGIFVTSSGYQRGAKEIAAADGISIFELRPPKDEDWDGYIKEVVINANISIPRYENISLYLDKEWLLENDIDTTSIGTGFSVRGNEFLYNGEKEPICTYADLINQLIRNCGNTICNVEHIFEQDTFVCLNNRLMKLKCICGDFGYSVVEEKIKIDAADFVGLILKDVINNTTRSFDKKNKLRE